ncbi:MAG: glycosyltransferase family 4 protein, partial [Actinobacteria bacterium]|nr:glycosyltransferase family 4 protein [Actinomycetota bacterium]
QPAARLLPVLRTQSPDTRVIIDSIDLHFLRDARRRFGAEGELDSRFGDELVRELNTYQAADAVLAVSAKEAELLSDFLGPGRVHCLPLTEPLSRSAVPLDDRRGILFVGNFRHLPNGEAIEYLCRDVLPRLDPDLLADHPLTVIGNRLDDKVRAHATGLPDVRMIGWVPSIIPYLERTRVCVVPLLHGAGVKGKVIQALMLGTPVVTTTIGAEGLDLEHGEHALISDDPGDLAAAIGRVLTDGDTWHRLAEAGAAHARATHDPAIVREEFGRVVDEVLARPAAESILDDAFRHSRRRALAYRATKAAFRDVVQRATEPGSIVLVVSKGDDDLVDIDGRTAWHFPQGPDEAWAGYHPADSASAIRHLEAVRNRGARYLALPNTAFWWLHHYCDFGRHLWERHRRIHSDEEVVVFDLGDSARRDPESSVSEEG